MPQFFDNDTKVTYRVKSGDYLGKIARQYSVGVNQIKQWNGLRNNNLRVGQRLTIYPRGTPSASKPAPTSSNTSTVTNTAGRKPTLLVKVIHFGVLPRNFQGFRSRI